MTSGPSMIRNEDGLLTGYVYVDIAGRDPSGYIEEAGRAAQGEDEASRRATPFPGAASTRPCSGSRSG